MRQYSTTHTGPNQRLGAVQGGFASPAYQCALAGEWAGENRKPTAPAPSASPKNSTKVIQLGRACRPRYEVWLSTGILMGCAVSASVV
jgi:hypothetical protein